VILGRENLFGLALFNNLAALHHKNPIGDRAHDAKVVTDEQIG